MQEHNIYTIIEFANLLRVHPNTVRRMIKKGKIFSFAFGSDTKKTYRIPHSELKKLAHSNVEDDLNNI